MTALRLAGPLLQQGVGDECSLPVYLRYATHLLLEPLCDGLNLYQFAH